VTIQDLGSIGELVAALATIATLIYLSVQIRANTVAMKSDSRRSNRIAGTPMMVAMVQDRDVARIFNAGLADFSALDPEDQTRFGFLLGDFIANAANTYDDVLLGVLSESDFEIQKRVISPYFRTPGGRQFWAKFRKRYQPEFQEYVEREILARLDPPSPAE